MTKKQLYIALGVALVAVLGVIGYLGMGGGEVDVEAGPPVLEENPSLSGTLSAAGGRYFQVENDFENGSIPNIAENERDRYLLRYSEKSLSNYLIFTTPKNFSNTTLDEVAENLIVDDGLSGYVLGTYRPAEGGWNLYPSKNYLGAQSLSESVDARACETYFVIKISDDHNSANGFDTTNDWTSEERSKIAFDESYFASINSGADDCSIEDKNLVEDSWNMITTKVSSESQLLNEFVGFDKVYAIWDTTVINQIDRSVNPAQTRNANQKLFVDSENTGSVNNLDDYFNGLIKSAEVFDADDNYDGGKQDLWVYVGSEAVVAPPVNTPPKLYPYEQTVDLSSIIAEKRKEAIEDGSWNNIFFFATQSLELPGDSVFAASDLDNDTVNLLANSSNGFDLELRGSEIFASATDLKYSDLNLNTNGSKLFTLDTEVSDGVDSLTETSGITYEWDNKCVAIDNAYMEHLRKSLEHMVYKSFPKDEARFNKSVDNSRLLLVEKIKEARTADLENGGSKPLDQEVIDKLTEDLDKMFAGITYDPKYLENPPYLPATCGGGVASCVDIALCGTLVETIAIEKLGLGSIIENQAFKESPKMETQSMIMSPDPQTIDLDALNKIEQSVEVNTSKIEGETIESIPQGFFGESPSSQIVVPSNTELKVGN